MNRKIVLNINLISLAALFSLALSLSPHVRAEKDALVNITSGSSNDSAGPAFLNYAKEQQTQKSNESAKPIEDKDKNNNTKTTNKKSVQKTNEASRQAAIISQKDKTIRQLRQQLEAKESKANTAPDNQKQLTDKIQQLEKQLAEVVAEKQKLINKELSSTAEIKKSIKQLNSTENNVLQQEKKRVAAESAKQKLELQLAEITTEKQTLIKKLAAAETAKQDTASKLTIAVSEKQTLMTKLQAEEKQRQALTEKLATSAPDKNKLAAAEKSQQELTSKLAAADAAQRALKTKLDASETAQKALVAKLTAYETEKQDLTVKLTAAAEEKKALTAKLDSFTASKQQSALQESTVRLQAEKDKALLQANANEINQLKTRLADAESKSGKKATDLDLAKEPQQQAYSIGVSMGEEALKVLSTRSSQGVTISKDTVLQGILDAFAGKIALDEKVRNKALFDVSKKVFKNLNKIEQQTISEGKKYQQNFAKQKGVVFKDGVYSRIDYAGEGRILDTDTVTVTIKETLIDGTVINDMEAEGKVWTQTLKSYPPLFLGPIKRLGNHGSITIVIPPELAYGSEGQPPKIPPGATMVYSVRIVDATAAKPQDKKP